jgi:hypothetical protein
MSGKHRIHMLQRAAKARGGYVPTLFVAPLRVFSQQLLEPPIIQGGGLSESVVQFPGNRSGNLQTPRQLEDVGVSAERGQKLPACRFLQWRRSCGPGSRGTDRPPRSRSRQLRIGPNKLSRDGRHGRCTLVSPGRELRGCPAVPRQMGQSIHVCAQEGGLMATSASFM